MLLCAAALRLYGLDEQSLWNDELASWHQSSLGSPSEVIRRGVAPDVHPPAHPLLLHFTQRLLGDSEWALRLPSALGGVLAVWVISALGRLLFAPREGLVAAAIAAVAWCPIFYAQEARAYSLLLLASAAATLCWLRLVRDFEASVSPPAAARAGLVASATACAYLHYFGLFFVALLAAASAAFALRRPRSVPTLALAFGLVGAAYLPWMPELWRDLGRDTSWIERPGPSAALDSLAFFFNRSTGLALFALALYAALAAVCVRDARRSGTPVARAAAPELFALAWLVLPFAIVYGKSLVSVPVLTERNLIVSLPAAYLLLARAICRLPLRAPLQHLVGGAVILGIALHTIVTLDYYRRPTKQQFREAVRFVVEHETDFERPLVIGNVYEARFLDYYFERFGSGLRVRALGGRLESLPRVRKVIADEAPAHVWYIAAHLPTDPRFLEALGESMELVGAQRFLMADVVLFRTRRESGPHGTSGGPPAGGDRR